MLLINFHFDDEAALEKMHEQIHDSLTGSPAYIDSEILLSNRDDNEPAFMLVVGNDNDSNLKLDVAISKKD